MEYLQKKAKIFHPSHRSERGTVLALGQGDVGQLGLGEDYMERKRPTVVPFPEEASGNIVDIFAAGMHTICVTENGEDGNGPFGLTVEGMKKLPLPFTRTRHSGPDLLWQRSPCDADRPRRHLYDRVRVARADGRIAECFSIRGGRKGLSLLLEPALVIRPKIRGQGKVFFEDVWCTPYCTFARVRGGGVYGWGLNNYHHLGQLTTF
ncbi:putative regulator of chromosome condensation [Apostichopus japonicus]|uniref:Putative regulator of chromosome condensation n=1 Tax=Stichopus japonicus TaxID=307972 RepID=A0A2G8JKX7_STIJA|nr:putative regulator of chromosome condensation [Apostichopus japonicus]